MKSLPLHDCSLKTTEAVINWLHIFIHGAAILALLYYRIVTLIHVFRSGEAPFLPHFLVFFAEFILSFLWLLHRASRWRPVKRVVFPERLPPDETLPPVDIFICTADPAKEPSIGVMNTVISAMALDYPPDKLAVYLSDDGGAPVTLAAMRDSWKFAKVWVPFCRKYDVKTRCPEAYFSGTEGSMLENDGFAARRNEIEKEYMEFKKKLEKNSETIGNSVSKDHPPVVEVINDEDSSASQKGMPLLVYMAREKRPSHPHHFKAGAINSLLRVSAIISNAPYFSVLDCDHYCNDPTSTRQAMCFYFDPELSPKLAFVQFPQRFHNISKHDLYDGNIKYYLREWDGLDGLQGPGIAGCNFYMKREAPYRMEHVPKDASLNQLKKIIGSSIELIKSTFKSYEPSVSRDNGKVYDAVKEELHLVASCTYENGTEWGTEIGIPYGSLVEDALLSLILHSSGWKSVLINPPRACYLGTCPTNLNDTLVQQTRWAHGLLTISLSKYTPLLYGPPRMSIFQSMVYGAMTMDSLYFMSLFILGIVPQICLLHGISLYPNVSSPFFYLFVFVFVSSQLKHVQEVVSSGDPLETALYELRIWIMKSVSCYSLANLNTILNLCGLNEANFTVTSKVSDDYEQVNRYQNGIYEFDSSPQLLAPMCSLYIINFVAFFVGSARFFLDGKWDELVVQCGIPLFGMLVNHHLFDGMFLRADKGRISPYITWLSVGISALVLVVGSLVMLHLI